MIIIDPPRVEAHGRVWSHLASDTSLEELHTFARRIGVPERGFDGDHYDVPSEWYDEVVAAGATPVSSRELVTRLTAPACAVRSHGRSCRDPPGAHC